MKKPLLIITQDGFFEQWLEKKKEAEARLKEEKVFFEKRFKDAEDKYLEPIWKELVDECVARGLLKEGEVISFPEAESKGKFLSIEDDVLFLRDYESGSGFPRFLAKLFD